MKYIYDELKISHSREFFAIAGNEKVSLTMRFNRPDNIEESDNILKEYISKGNRSFLIRTEDYKTVGIFAFKESEDMNTSDLSLMISPEFWGKGAGSTIVSHMVKLAEREKWYRELQGYILETNMASRKIVLNTGFKEKERHRFPEMTEDLIVYKYTIKA